MGWLRYLCNSALSRGLVWTPERRAHLYLSLSLSLSLSLQVAFNLFLLFAVPSPINFQDCIPSGAIVQSGNCTDLASDGTGNNPTANYRTTIIYNSFVWAQLFNEISSRKIYNEMNCFDGILTNGMFIGVMLFSAVLQFLTVQILPPYIFNAVPLSGMHWLLCLILGFLSIPIGMATRILPPLDSMCRWFPTAGNPETAKVTPESPGPVNEQ